ncbi:E3 ubiquitin-protein ligase RGLG2-like [Cornus florida]|uniref:E3 ubiquitin-protein ligase RGLG2-like n=1 Tax=Cornus florida TaxID=4283 RepID=UPI00289F101B|nr:E3 ubiquitin-protein ligase RGLG2-like [Cornus florida]
MGGKQTKPQSYYRNASTGSGSPPIPSSTPYPSYAENYANSDKSRLQSRYTRIGDNYRSLEEVTRALAQDGLESSNLIVGIDFTKSNEWTGARSFNKKSLHHLGDDLSPYEHAISIIGRTLSAFDEDSLIPCYGFGDATTHDQDVFSFYPDDEPCNGFEEALLRYRELVPQIRLAGPTSFAPIIETAIGIVDNSGGQYHVLLIIADGQVTGSVDSTFGQWSSQERNTIDAIVRASQFPLSIVLVGVGDGPWDMMQQFDDNIPSRTFDNFQFVNFTEIMLSNIPTSNKETQFALAALMEIPSQYKATIDLQLLGCRRGTPRRIPLPPPPGNHNSSNLYPSYPMSSNFGHGSGVYHAPSMAHSESNQHNRNCPLCLSRKKDLVFGCGHQTCYDCGRDLAFCLICQTCITTRIRLFE